MKAHRGEYVVGIIALVVVDLINVALPLLVKVAVDALSVKAWNPVIWAGLGYFLLMALQAAGRYLWRLYFIGTSHRIAQELRLRLYSHLQRLPVEYYHQVRTGDLMSRATNDIESVRMAVGPGVLVTLDMILVFLMIVPVMIYLSPKLTLLAFVLYPVVPYVTAKLGDKIDILFESLQTRMSQMGAFAQETFTAIRLVKSLVLEDRSQQRFSALSENYRGEGILQAKYSAVFSPALGLLTNFGTFLILLLGGMDVISGAITLGTFVAFQRFVVQLSWPMEAIGWVVTMNREGISAQRRLDQVFSHPEAASTTVPPAELNHKDSASLLEIRDLTLNKGVGDFKLAVRGVSVSPARKIGIVGAVGAGKSTFLNAILRLYEPNPRGTFFKGIDICAIPTRTLRTEISSVEQQIFLFSETVADNISMGATSVPGLETIKRAAGVACLEAEIESLPQGYFTLLGERGVNLSGGQKQRLALARALVRNPKLLLLDDAFSAVDVAIERKIIENLLGTYPELSFLFASHRMSIMPLLDEIWVMHEGQIVETGTHAHLLQNSLYYQRLWEKSQKESHRQSEETGLGQGSLL